MYPIFSARRAGCLNANNSLRLSGLLYLQNVLGRMLVGMREDIRRSLKLNRDLGRLLEQALEVDRAIKIGWSRSGDEIPKDGEMGVAPALPKGGRVRILGKLTDVVVPFASGGAFTLVGSADDYFGAWNSGANLIVERGVKNHLGYAMSDGRIIARDGAGDDVGATMSGGLLIVRGDAGKRVGGGMQGGIIIIHGDVAAEPGAGIQGGKIIINGRCPSPGEGVEFSTLSADELMAVNHEIDDASLEVPPDALCLIPAKQTSLRPLPPEAIQHGDWSTIGMVVGEHSDRPLHPHQTIDTMVILGERNIVEGEMEPEPIGLPLPIIPTIDSGKDLKGRHLSMQPCLVRREARSIDLVYIDSENIHEAHVHLPDSGGLVLDLFDLPPLTLPALDGLLVSLRSMVGEGRPFMLVGDVNSVERLHLAAASACVDGVISRVADASGIPAVAALPRTGRSAGSADLHATGIAVGYSLPWSASGNDLAIACAAGGSFVITRPPDEAGTTAKFDSWLEGLHCELRGEMVRLGCDSIDKLGRRNLRALDHETASISGLRLAGYGRPLPHWFAS